jgi:hypothetical protein
MKITAFCLCWLLILTAPGVMAQRTDAPSQSWDVLRKLQTGNKVEVGRKPDKKQFEWKMVSLSETELVIERKGKTLSFSRDEVRRIWYRPPPGRPKRIMNTVFGGAGGFFLALLLGAAAGTQCGDCEATVFGAAAGVGAATALLGYFTTNGRRALIYIAP